MCLNIYLHVFFRLAKHAYVEYAQKPRGQWVLMHAAQLVVMISQVIDDLLFSKSNFFNIYTHMGIDILLFRMGFYHYVVRNKLLKCNNSLFFVLFFISKKIWF